MKILFPSILPIIIPPFPQVFPARLSQEKIKQIDSLFISLNQPNHPGGAIGVKRNKKNRIIGLQVSNGRVRNLWFEKR